MLVSCKCLNLGIDVNSVLYDCVEIDFSGFDSNEFFAENYQQKLRTAIPKKFVDSANIQKIPAFVENTVLNGWTIKKCLICDTNVFAECISFSDRILIDPSHVKSSEDLEAIQNSAAYSRAFEIALPNQVDSIQGNERVLSLPLVHCVSQVLRENLRKERYALEEKIQNFVDSERAKFDQFKSKAKLDESMLLRSMSNKVFLANQTSGAADGQIFSSDPPEPINCTLPFDEYDSGVPVSPVSLRSARGVGGAHSPMGIDLSDFGGRFIEGSQATKSFAISTKRKRHSGGSGKPPSLNDRRFYRDHMHQDVFSLEENDDLVGDPVAVIDDENYAADESSDSDQFQKIASAVARVEVADSPPSAALALLGRSLPVNIASSKASVNFGEFCGPIDDVTRMEDCGPDFDIAASMQALARGTLPHDGPENLFGDRPGRRRFKSSFDRPILEPVPDVDAF